MQTFIEKLAYLRKHEDFSILYTRPIPRDRKGQLLIGGTMARDEQGRTVVLSKQLGTDHLNFTWEHQYQVGPCLLEAEVLDFERRHSSSIPDEYRRFLVEVGNGGAGPGYSLYALGEHTIEDTLDHHVTSIFVDQPYQGSRRSYDAILEEVQNGAELPTGFTKFLPIAYLGCTYHCVLIMDGIERGNIWEADFGGDPSLFPVDKLYGTRRVPEGYVKKAVSFYDWYNGWLEQQIADLRERIMAVG